MHKHLNSELLGTLCDKRHNAVIVMHLHLSLARENTTPTRAITVILYANSCICLQVWWPCMHNKATIKFKVNFNPKARKLCQSFAKLRLTTALPEPHRPTGIYLRDKHTFPCGVVQINLEKFSFANMVWRFRNVTSCNKQQQSGSRYGFTPFLVCLLTLS